MGNAQTSTRRDQALLRQQAWEYSLKLTGLLSWIFDNGEVVPDYEFVKLQDKFDSVLVIVVFLTGCNAIEKMPLTVTSVEVVYEAVVQAIEMTNALTNCLFLLEDRQNIITIEGLVMPKLVELLD